MEIKIKVDAGDTLKAFEDMAPERFMKNWAVAIANLARKNAFEKGGRSFWKREIGQSVKEEVTGPATGSVYSDSYIAEHVHTGGVIRPNPPAKFLAIPIDKSIRRKKIFARDYPWPGGKPVFMQDKSGKVYLGAQLKTKVKPLFVLKRSVMQQARPWWPSEAETEAESRRFFEQDF